MQPTNSVPLFRTTLGVKHGLPKQHSDTDSDEKQEDSNDGETDEKDGSSEEMVIYTCPWPGCSRKFDKVKSRSAHLKWHGGDYKASEDDGTGHRINRTKEKEKESAPATANPTTHTAKRPAKLSNPPRKRPKHTARTTRLGAGDKVVLYKSIEQPSLAGKFGTIDAVLPSGTHSSWSTYRVAIAHKGRVKYITLPEHLVALTGSSDATSVNKVSAVYEVGAKVYGAKHSSHGAGYRPGAILEKRSGSAGEPTQYKFRPYSDSDNTMWLTTKDIVADVAPTISQLRTGMKVCALPEKTGKLYYAGTIQRIETSRIRVNFERFSIAWRKVSNRACGCAWGVGRVGSNTSTCVRVCAFAQSRHVCVRARARVHT